MMLSKKIIIAVFASLLLVLVKAQVTPVQPGIPNELDQKFSPGKTAILGQGNAVNSSGSSEPRPDVEFKNAIKNNLALWPRSIAAFGYERFLAEEISLEGWLGLSYNKDAIFGMTGSELNFSSTYNDPVRLNSIYQLGVRDGMSLYFAGSVKFHFGGWSYWNNNNSYIELTMRKHANKLDVQAIKDNYNKNASQYNSGQFTGSTDVKVKHTCYLVNFGYRFTAGEKIMTSHEFYTGVGWRNVSYDYFARTQEWDPFLGNYVNKIEKNGERKNGSSPLFVFGYILGFGFK